MYIQSVGFSKSVLYVFYFILYIITLPFGDKENEEVDKTAEKMNFRHIKRASTKGMHSLTMQLEMIWTLTPVFSEEFSWKALSERLFTDAQWLNIKEHTRLKYLLATESFQLFTSSLRSM